MLQQTRTIQAKSDHLAASEAGIVVICLKTVEAIRAVM